MPDPDSLTTRGAAIFAQLRQDESEVPPAPTEASDEEAPSPPQDEGTDAEAVTEDAVDAAAEGTDEARDEAPDEASDQEEHADIAVEDAPVPATGPGRPAPADGPRAPTMPADVPASPSIPGRDLLPELPDVAAAAPVSEPSSATVSAEVRRDAAGNALPRILAVANQKGGVGKTTTAVNLGAALAEAGYRTLVVDLDPQGNASTGLGINIRDLQLSMYDVVIHEASIDDTIEATAMKNLFVAPSSLDLAGAEIELVPAFSRELRLRNALAEVHDDFDYVLIDCPPSLGLLTVNGLAAAREVLVPIQCEYYALEGLGQLLRNVALVQRNLNKDLEVSTFVCVMYDARTKLADQVVTEVREHFGDRVCRIVVPRTVRLSEAPSYGQPILAFDPRSRGAIAYRELAREVSGGPVTTTDPDIEGAS